MDPLSNRPSRTRIVSTVLQCLAVAAPLLLMHASPAAAATVCPAGGTLDARLASVADEGVMPLVHFVNRTRMIYQLNVAEALDRVAHYRQNVAECMVSIDE